TTEPVSAAASVSAVNAKMPVSSLLNIDADDLEEMDLKWKMAMLTVRARRFIQRTKGHFTRECRSPKDSRRNGAAEPQRRNVLVETSTSNALVSQCDGVGSYDWSFQAEEETTNYALMAFSSSSSSFDNEVVSCSKACTKAYAQLQSHYDMYQLGHGYHAVPPPYTGTFMPPDLVFNNPPHDVETDHPTFTVKLSHTKPNQDLSFTNRPSAPIIEDWVSDTEDESEIKTPQNVPSFVQSTEHMVPAVVLPQSKPVSITAVRPVSIAVPNSRLTAVKAPVVNAAKGNPQHALKDKGVIDTGCSRHMTGNMSYLSDFEDLNGGYVAFGVEHPIPAKNLRDDIPRSRVHRHRWNKKACFVCKSLTHLIKECDYYEKKMVQTFIRNHAMRGNLKHYARMTHSHPNRHVVPTSVLTRSRLVPLTATRPITTIVHQNKVKHHRPAKHVVNQPHSPIRRPINLRTSPKNSNFHQQVTNVKANQVNAVQGVKENWQNGIAKRKNRTIIEAVRTMLADSLLPIPFWAEALNTACYVQNRVLVTKPHNKTPYKLLYGRTPSIGFMKPFGSPATILNTLDSLGKFDAKVDEGFLVGYSVSSKAFRVFNSRTRIFQDTLHVNFLENKPNVAGSGPTWLFDIGTLTKTMNYQPVTTGNQSNPSSGVQEQFHEEKVGEEIKQQYVLFPVWSSGSTNPQNTNRDAAFDEKEF
nr:retrovirus-related Pol polyprotein from transposon TNT 1-94 [Tanacetum cinerariifolium]